LRVSGCLKLRRVDSRESQEQAGRIQRGEDKDVFDQERRKTTSKEFRETKEHVSRAKSPERSRERTREREPPGGSREPD
jgi:hypothetical protein